MDDHLTTVLWRHKLLVAACVALTVAAALGATLLQDEVYEARATLQAGTLVDRNGGGSPEANQALARSYAEVLTSGSFLERVRSQVAGGGLSVRELADRLDAKAIQDTAIVRLSARGESPAEARRLAAGITSSFVRTLRVDATIRVQRQQAGLDALVADVTRRIEALQRQDGAEGTLAQLRASRQALLEQGAELAANGVAEAGSARRIGPPSASSDPVSPRPRLNAVAGIVLGLLIGATLAWWREARAPALRSPDHAASIIDVPVLATIPLRRRVSPQDPVLGEAYDVLRANLTFQSRQRRLGVISVIAKNAGVGKTSTVEGLAYAIVRSGGTVAVVDADLRRGSLSERFLLHDRPGLPEVVAADLTLDQALVEPVPGLHVLPASAAAPNPPAILDNAITRSVIRRLADRHDLVLIDAPPIAQLADGLIAASVSDGVLMVARTGVTSRPDLASGAARVRQTHTPIIGLVVFAGLEDDTAYYPAATGSGARPGSAALAR